MLLPKLFPLLVLHHHVIPQNRPMIRGPVHHFIATGRAAKTNQTPKPLITEKPVVTHVPEDKHVIYVSINLDTIDKKVNKTQVPITEKAIFTTTQSPETSTPFYEPVIPPVRNIPVTYIEVVTETVAVVRNQTRSPDEVKEIINPEGEKSQGSSEDTSGEETSPVEGLVIEEDKVTLPTRQINAEGGNEHGASDEENDE